MNEKQNKCCNISSLKPKIFLFLTLINNAINMKGQFAFRPIIYIILFIITGSLMHSCTNKSSNIEGNNITINVNMEGLEFSGIIYLERMNTTRTIIIDSIMAGDISGFSFNINPKQANDIYILRFSHKQAITLVLSENDKINIIIKEQPVNTRYTISGSIDSEIMFNINRVINNHTEKYDKIYGDYRNAAAEENIDVIRATTDSLLRLNQISIYTELKQIIQSHPTSLSSLIGLYSKFGSHRILDLELDYTLFKLVSDSLSAKYPNNIHSIALQKTIKNFKIKNELIENTELLLDKGNVFPDLSLISLDNTIYNIKDNQSKVKLIYIWKSKYKKFWDTNPILISLYKSYSRKDFDVIAISFEKDKLAWSNYCSMGRFEWVNLLASPDDEATINPYGIYPRIYVLDSDFKIIAKDPDVNELESIINASKDNL